LASPSTKVDVVGIPSTDPERSRQFYVETLGLYAPYEEGSE
jgi:catechol 2,3-dioxygenase-like lactoylglutathione lyase family enzyme